MSQQPLFEASVISVIACRIEYDVSNLGTAAWFLTQCLNACQGLLLSKDV